MAGIILSISPSFIQSSSQLAIQSHSTAFIDQANLHMYNKTLPPLFLS